MRTPHPVHGPSDWRDWTPGLRVVVRRRLSRPEAAAAGKIWTDVIGVVVQAGPDGVVLRRDPARADAPDAGVVVHVPATEIEAARPLPPRPRRSRPS